MESPRKKHPGRKPGAHFECDFIDDPRVHMLNPVQWTVYSKLWIMSVQSRRDIMCRSRWSLVYISLRSKVSRNSLPKALDLLHKIGLIYMTDHYIKINGVKKLHSKMHWKEPHQCCIESCAELGTVKPSNAYRPEREPEREREPEPDIDFDESEFDQNNPGILLIRDWPQILSEAGLPFEAVPDMARAEKHLPGGAGLKALRETCEWAIEKWGYDRLRARLLTLAGEHAAGTRTLYSLKNILQTPQVIENENNDPDWVQHNKKVIEEYSSSWGKNE